MIFERLLRCDPYLGAFVLDSTIMKLVGLKDRSCPAVLAQRELFRRAIQINYFDLAMMDRSY